MKGIDAKLQAALEAHSNMEAGNAMIYLTAYSWLRANGWEGFSRRFKNDAFGEFGHAQNFIKYLARRGANCVLAPSQTGIDSSSIDAIAENAAKLEEATEASMGNLVTIAASVGDNAAVEYISGKLVDQELESKQARDFADRVKDAAGQIGCLVILDRKIEKGGW